MKPKILLSGFEPFGGETVNPSAELIRDIAWLQPQARVFQIETVLLPVTFAEAYETLAACIRRTDPDIVISLGQASGRDKLTVERVGINCLDAEIADNAGIRPVDQPIRAGAPAALFASLPVRKMVEAGIHAGVPCAISNTAGTYVCNFLLYRMLDENRFSRRRCGFVHLPYLPEQAKIKNPPPASMSLDAMKTGLAAMLDALRGS